MKKAGTGRVERNLRAQALENGIIGFGSRLKRFGNDWLKAM